MYSGTDILLRLFDRVVAHPARCAPCATPVRTRLFQGFGKSASYAAREGSPHMSSPHPLHQAAIVGVYNTKQGRLLEGSTTDSLTLEATFGAIADAGISPGEVDGIVTRDFRPMASQLGRRPCWFSSGGASISGLIEATLEVYGFYGEGEGGDFVMDGRVRIDGALPICADGGLMSFSHSAGAQALQRVIAGVLQIQGRAPNQVDNVRNVLTENFGSGALWTNQMIVSSDPAD